MPIKISDLIKQRNNGLTITRLLLSFCVTLSHSYPLAVFTNEIGGYLTSGQDSLGSFAVKSFMAISGLLITPSFYRNQIKDFFAKRVLRIFPGFWFCILLTVFIFIPIIDYQEDHIFSISVQEKINYLLNNLFLECRQFGITGILNHVPYPYAINGSLWTLYPEFKGYIFIAIMGSLALLEKSFFTIFGFFILLVIYLFESRHPGSTLSMSQMLSPVGLNWPDSSTLQLAIYLMSGIIIYHFSQKIYISKIGYITSFSIFVVSIYFHIYTYFQPFILLYFILCFSYYLPERIKNLGNYGDLSYGYYLYSFPLQQILSVLELQRYGFLVYNLLTFACVFPLAIISWFLIENPSLKFSKFCTQDTPFSL